jgi:hypothetical protein
MATHANAAPKITCPVRQIDLRSIRSRISIHFLDDSPRGQEFAKRALVVAAAGGHNVVMMWSNKLRIQKVAKESNHGGFEDNR